MNPVLVLIKTTKHIVFILFFLLSFSLLGNEITSEKLNFGMNKNINTYKFNFQLNKEFKTSVGDFGIIQDYDGTAILNQLKSIREEENLTLSYGYNLFGNYNYKTYQNWTLFSDPKALNNNELQRLSTLHGFRFDKEQYVIELVGGLENNRQFNISETGIIIEPFFKFENIDIYSYRFSSVFDGSFLKLKDDRINNLFNLNSRIFKNFGSDIIDLSYNRNYHNRDIFYIGNSENNENPSIENIFDDKYHINFLMQFELLKNLKTNVLFNYGKVSVERKYKVNNTDNINALLKKTFDEINTNFRINSIYENELIRQEIGTDISTRTEINDVFKNGDISTIELERQKSLEKQRDNNSSRTRIYSLTKIDFLRNYTLFLNYSASIYRYNTPSDDNNDDRDLSDYYFESGVSHKFSRFLTASLFYKFQNTHTVFLKSSRSGSNYQNKIYSLKPAVKYITKNFVMRPQLELLANYTIYDFENTNSGIRSFSFRQISYNDSLYYNLSENIGVYTEILVKYYERGLLFWDDFSETPELSSLENFTKLIIFSENDIFGLIRVGTGFRYYSLVQESLTNTNTGNNFNRISYGPETIISFNIGLNTEVIFNGWYEYQYSNGEFLRSLPNFYLQTRVNL